VKDDTSNIHMKVAQSREKATGEARDNTFNISIESKTKQTAATGLTMDAHFPVH
jgi:hypothetical protein